MSDQAKKTYFITGGNRGIGFHLVKILSASKDNTVITSIRGPILLPKNAQLKQLEKERDNIHVVQLDLTNEDSINKIADEVKNTPSFEGIDVFISNSAISDAYFEVLRAPKDVWLDHYTTNVLGPIFTFQRLYPFPLRRRLANSFSYPAEQDLLLGFFLFLCPHMVSLRQL